MSSGRSPQSDSDLIKAKDREIAALKELVDRLSRQVYGRVMPGLYAFPSGEDALPPDATGAQADGIPGKMPGAFRESAASYHVSEPVFVPPDFPSDEVDLELPAARTGGMSVVSYETSEAIAARPAVMLRTVRRALYVANDGSGMSAAADPRCFPIRPAALGRSMRPSLRIRPIFIWRAWLFARSLIA